MILKNFLENHKKKKIEHYYSKYKYFYDEYHRLKEEAQQTRSNPTIAYATNLSNALKIESENYLELARHWKFKLRKLKK